MAKKAVPASEVDQPDEIDIAAAKKQYKADNGKSAYDFPDEKQCQCESCAAYRDAGRPGLYDSDPVMA